MSPDRHLGIFSDIAPGTDAERAAAIAAAGFTCVQLRPPRDVPIDAALLRSVAAPYRDHGLAVVAVAGYTNLVHPDPAQREAGLQRLERLLAASAETGCGPVCTETGSRFAGPIRPGHPANAGEEAWADLMGVLHRLDASARRDGSTLALEGYVKNVAASLDALTRIADALPAVRYVCDPFNLLHEAEMPAHRERFEAITAWMRSRVAVAHAKDVLWQAGELTTPRAGAGQADWDAYAVALDRWLPGVPLVLEHVRWAEVPATLAFVRERLARSAQRAAPTLKMDARLLLGAKP